MSRNDKGQFIPGESGNPNGRPPRGEALTEILRSRVDKDAIAERLVALAFGETKEGDMAAIKYIYDRLDGKPIETINQNVHETPKVIRFERADNPDTGQDIQSVGESEET